MICIYKYGILQYLVFLFILLLSGQFYWTLILSLESIDYYLIVLMRKVSLNCNLSKDTLQVNG